jgi:hypothetical protein
MTDDDPNTDDLEITGRPKHRPSQTGRLYASTLPVAVHKAAMQLIENTPGAKTLDDVVRIRDADMCVLLSEEAGLPLEVVQPIILEDRSVDE